MQCLRLTYTETLFVAYWESKLNRMPCVLSGSIYGRWLVVCSLGSVHCAHTQHGRGTLLVSSFCKLWWLDF